MNLDGVIKKLLKFADDTKIVSKVGTAEDVKVLPEMICINYFNGFKIGKCYSIQIKVK